MKRLEALTRRGRTRRYRRALDDALESYALDVTAVEFVSMDSKPVFRVRAETGRYAAKFHNPQEHVLPQMTGEMAFLDHVDRNTALRVETPVANTRGKFLTEVRSEWLPEPAHVALCSWVPGRSLRNAISVRPYRVLGRCAATLHEASGTFRPGPDFRILTNDRVFYWDAETILSRTDRRLLPKRRQERLRAGARLAGAAIRKLWKSGSPIVIHNDLHPSNIKVHRGHLALYDFEDLTWGFPEQDIGTAMYYVRFRDDYLELLGAFRAGYEETRPWPFASGAGIDLFVMARVLMLANYVVNYEIRPSEHVPRLDENLKVLLKAIARIRAR